MKDHDASENGGLILRGVMTLLAVVLVGFLAWSSIWVVKPNEAGVIRAFGAVTTVRSARHAHDLARGPSAT